MNLGFYVDKTDGSERNVEIFNALNAAETTRKWMMRVYFSTT